MQDLEELTGSKDSMQPCFQLVDHFETAEPNIAVVQQDVEVTLKKAKKL